MYRACMWAVARSRNKVGGSADRAGVARVRTHRGQRQFNPGPSVAGDNKGNPGAQRSRSEDHPHAQLYIWGKSQGSRSSPRVGLSPDPAPVPCARTDRLHPRARASITRTYTAPSPGRETVDRASSCSPSGW